uniref:MATH domain-containing protein n=1 Tax=Meloidogyne floridensis TaxID=298350 RepID=A0A915NYP3_9BILA
MSSNLLKNEDNSTTSNSFNDSSASHSQQNKRRRTLELQMEETSLEIKSIQDNVDLENFKIKLLKDKSDLQNLLKEEINKNEKLAAEKEEYKKQSEFNWEQWAQLGRDHIKIGNELNKLKEDHQNSSKAMLNEKNELAKKLEKINKENTKLREEKNLNLKELENYRNACQLPIDEKSVLLKQNNYLSAELQHANSELTKCRNELALNLKLRYVPITNKINEINNYLTCCGNKCINSNLSEGTCTSKQGFIRAQDNGMVKYYSAKNKETKNNHQTRTISSKELSFTFSCYAGIGFNKDDNTPLMLMSNNLFKNYFELKQNENNIELTNIKRINNWLLLKNEENQKEFTRIETEKGTFFGTNWNFKKENRGYYGVFISFETHVEKSIVFSSLEKEVKQIRRSTTKNETENILNGEKKSGRNFIIYFNGKPFDGNEFLAKPKK